ncbi:MFS transporter [Acrocarpospora catenulata]|uniref:MFS transporter n=1 Tax=Acrocarpospora catenulata TaxID=2836182 RepID=UPI001BDA2E81|nr:MFS transporter [Acrocarpospora catenulata]
MSPHPHDRPDEPADLPFRLVRSAAFATVCVLLAALGHRLAGGDGPTTWGLTVAGLAVFGSAAALAGRERSPALIAGLLLAAQAGLHELFNHGATVKAVLGIGLTASGGHHGQGLGITIGMLLAHLTASLVTAWWLARGENALWALLRRVGAAARGLVRLLDATAPLVLAPVVPVRAEQAPRPRRGQLRHTLVRRGPPLPA